MEELLLKDFCKYLGVKDCETVVKSFLAKRKEQSLPKTDNTITVFTDGACSNNGRSNASAGIGLYFENTKETYSDNVRDILQDAFPELKDIKLTNNIAELLAIYKALHMILDNVSHNNYKVIIKTDSMYSINIFTKWYKTWQKKNWVTATGKPVLNKEIIVATLKLIQMMPKIDFVHISAHTQAPSKNGEKYADWYGNSIADKMAVEGTRQ
jgi:ribonuclease HI